MKNISIAMKTSVSLVWFLFVFLTPLGAEADVSVQNSGVEKENKNLDLFGYEVFREELPGLSAEVGGVLGEVLFERFGKPEKIDSRIGPADREGPPSKPRFNEITLYFEGIKVEASASILPKLPYEKREYYIGRIIVSEPEIELQYGLRVGQPVADFLSILGKPFHSDNKSMLYNMPINQARYYNAEVKLTITPDRKVEEIQWRWFGH